MRRRLRVLRMPGIWYREKRVEAMGQRYLLTRLDTQPQQLPFVPSKPRTSMHHPSISAVPNSQPTKGEIIHGKKFTRLVPRSPHSQNNTTPTRSHFNRHTDLVQLPLKRRKTTSTIDTRITHPHRPLRPRSHSRSLILRFRLGLESLPCSRRWRSTCFCRL
ncbi:hypothetical protein RSOL_497790 [Rhizoctonia solani AG-3 Rhs1AP]|uniref:Uncharacterized protein n=1 Tax=Rhizoctonia solani AG-3 Rhs1AP TaxID=1086054 RepID=X8JQ31_9AGAM|nr:hypothetical protein RSOL_497790 [Rhizoctonia solani AG-3 Rhs1AP]